MSVQTSVSSRMSVGFAGQKSGTSHGDVVESMRNDETATEIAFGKAVKHDSTSDAQSAKLPAAITDIIAGIVLHSHHYNSDELGSTGVLPTNMLNVARKGRVLVPCVDAVEPGDRLHIVCVGSNFGGLRASADSTNTKDCTGQGEWRTAAGAGGLAVLEFDFTNLATNVD